MYCILFYTTDCAIGPVTTIDLGPDWGLTNLKTLEEFYYDTLQCTGYVPPEDFKPPPPKGPNDI